MRVLTRAWYLRVRGVLHCPGVASMASSRGVSHAASVAAPSPDGEHVHANVVDGVKLSTSLREFGERRSDEPVILQRNAVDGAQAKQQPRRDDKARIDTLGRKKARDLPAKRAIGRYRETSGNQVLAASEDCHPCARQKYKPAPHCKFGGAAALEQSVQAAASHTGATLLQFVRRRGGQP